MWWDVESAEPPWDTAVTGKAEGAPGGCRRPALPFGDGERHALQPLLVGLRGADLGDHGTQQFVHQFQHLVSILFDF